MRRVSIGVAVLALIAASCGKHEPSGPVMSSAPASVRGWIADIRTTPTNYTVVGKPASDAALRSSLFGRTNIYVEKTEFASGGISPGGSFILLDVPPGEVTVVFQIPGYADAKLKLSGVPDNADILVPDIIVGPDGARPTDPSKVVVRVPGEGKGKRTLNTFVSVAGVRVPVVETPLDDMADRRDYPEPTSKPAQLKPLAVVK